MRGVTWTARWAVGGGEPDAAWARRGRRRSRLLGHRCAQVAQCALRPWCRDRPRPDRPRRRDELVRRRGVHTAAAARRALRGRMGTEFSRRRAASPSTPRCARWGAVGLPRWSSAAVAARGSWPRSWRAIPGSRSSTTSSSTRCWSASRAMARTSPTRSSIVQREGTCWMSGTEWEGEPAMRISVCNWRTTEDDIRRSAKAILAQVDIAARDLRLRSAGYHGPTQLSSRRPQPSA